MSYSSLNQFVAALKQSNEIVQIDTFVNPDLEVAEINDRLVKEQGKAMLFTNNGTEFPLLVNMFGNEKRMCMALGVKNLDDIGKEIEELFKQVVSPKNNFIEKFKLLPELAKLGSWMPKKKGGKGKCQEVVMADPDFSKLPILKCWPYDGGKFITFPLVHTYSPVTNIPNCGMYRMQIYDKSTSGMHWHLHKTGAHHFEEWKKLGKRMPVTVVLGGDPIYTYSATAPLPENVDEYILAGFLRKKKVNLVKCLTNDIYVPEDADFVIEGYVDPSEPLKLEGPFGDHTGYYSLPDMYPVFHITCITHKKDAIFPATVVGTPPQEDQWLGKATERIFLTPIRLSMLPEVIDMSLPAEGGFHNISLVKFKNDYPGHAFKIMNSLWGAGQMMFNKIMVCVDENTDINNPMDLLDAIVKNVDFRKDVLFSKGPSDVLDHASLDFAYGGKIGLDATVKKDRCNSAIDKSLFAEWDNNSDVNVQLIRQGKSILLVNVQDENAFTELKLRMKEVMDSLWCVVFDPDVDVHSLSDVVWRLSNNIDPTEDVYDLENIVYVDARAKNKEMHFNRDWPNIVVSDKETIDLVDSKWEQYGIGELIKSPSLKYIERMEVKSAFRF